MSELTAYMAILVIIHVAALMAWRDGQRRDAGFYSVGLALADGLLVLAMLS